MTKGSVRETVQIGQNKKRETSGNKNMPRN